MLRFFPKFGTRHKVDQQRTRKLLLLHEGSEKFAYQDTLGFWTIGVGRNIDKRGGRGLSQDEINHLLDNDLRHAQEAISHRWPAYNYLSPVRKAVVVDMVHNLGIGGFMKFKITRKSIENGHYEKASKEMLQSKWATQVGRRALRLSEMMKTNRWPAGI